MALPCSHAKTFLCEVVWSIDPFLSLCDHRTLKPFHSKSVLRVAANSAVLLTGVTLAPCCLLIGVTPAPPDPFPRNLIDITLLKPRVLTVSTISSFDGRNGYDFRDDPQPWECQTSTWKSCKSNMGTLSSFSQSYFPESSHHVNLFSSRHMYSHMNRIEVLFM